ncbi:MAG: hypothetical protein HQM08_08015 [Candidatus Riflebacteria bacterium]|nr:hypothetical protein [Candidatus Riflebacteria bacterium]
MPLNQMFGLSVESEFPFEDFPPALGETQASVRLGEIPHSIPAQIPPIIIDKVGLKIFISDKEFLRINILNPARNLYIRNGTEIVLSQHFKRNTKFSKREKLQLLEFAFLQLWGQRGAIQFHASCVRMGGQAFLFFGKPGAGKTTISAALLARGHDKLSDDNAAITFDEKGHFFAVPFCTYQSVRPETADFFNLPNYPDDWDIEQGKFVLKALTRSPQPVPIGAFFFVIPENISEPKCSLALGLEKMHILFESSRTKELFSVKNNIDCSNIQAPSILSHLAKSLPFYKISRSTISPPHALANYLEASFLKKSSN